ncbi:MAG: alcohol dehydrogenase catalytic domain-containing protein [Candidatus Bathyarchaeota archaeon]|nr:alcohol dehydrogenase catalytic domain-containing protein [Candidatus Bathyarchaeota archaeon]
MGKTMKAAVKTAEGDFEIKEVPMPEITRPDYVLVKIRSAGVCGSDLHRWKVPVPASVGRISGHELAGDIVAVGKDVTNVKVGDRVGVDSVVPCGECYWCKVGQYHICPYKGDIRGKTFARAFCEYVAGPSSHVFPIPDHVGYGEAAIMDVYGTSVHAINRLDIHMNQKVVVIGAGPIGLSLLDLVNVAGADGIIIDIIDHPLEFAKNTIGAYATINSKKEDPVAKVMELTDGRGADVVVDCVGGGASAFLLPQAVEMVRRKGIIGMVGMPSTDLNLHVDWRKLQMGEVDLIGVSGFYHWGNDREFQIVTDLLSKGKLHATEMITHRFPLEKINEAFTVAADKQGTNSIKVVLDS